MKKAILAIALVAVAVPMVYGQSTQVLSRNAVGYIRVNAEPDKWQLVAPQFDQLDAAQMTVSNVVGGTDIPDSTVIYIWDPVGAKYIQESYIDGYGWWPGTNLLERGDGFWLQSPAGTNLYIMGEVPGGTASATTAVSLVTGYTIFSAPYPSERLIGDTKLADIAQDGDIIYSYNGTNYDQVSYIGGFGWWPTNFVFSPGESYWYKAGGNTNWDATKPYTWP